jgi:hypothetical protein
MGPCPTMASMVEAGPGLSELGPAVSVSERVSGCAVQVHGRWASNQSRRVGFDLQVFH